MTKKATVTSSDFREGDFPLSIGKGKYKIGSTLTVWFEVEGQVGLLRMYQNVSNVNVELSDSPLRDVGYDIEVPTEWGTVIIKKDKIILK